MSNTTFRSVFWSGLERFGAQAFQAVFTIVLARLLMPADYGLVAMIFIFLMIGQMLMDGGLSLALVQKKNPTEDDFSTVFWFNVLFSMLFYVAFVCCAPMIARFYEQPLLIPIIKIAGLNMIVWSFGLIHATKLEIALDFKRRAFITVSAMVLSGILGIVLAYYGYGVWALVFQFLANSTLKTLLYWLFSERWFPRMVFSAHSFKSLLRFGFGYMLAGLLDTTFKNMYAIFIGKRYTATELGYFQQAFSLSNLSTTNIAYTIASSFIPLQTNLHGNPDEQHKSFKRYLSLGCFITFPIAVWMAVLAEPFVAFVLTDKWLQAVPFIQILCLSYVWFPVLVINRRLLLAKGFSQQHLTVEIIVKVFGIAVFFACLPHGIGWICASIGLYTFFDMVVSICFVQKILGIRWMDEWKVVWPVLGASLISGLVMWCTARFFDDNFLKLLFGALSGVSLYVLGSYLLALDELKFIVNYLNRHA